MSRAYGENLPDVMGAVNEMEPPPLVNAERAKEDVGDARSGAEERLGFVEEAIDAGQMFGDGTGEIVAGERRGETGRDHLLRSFAAAREETELDEIELGKALLEGRVGLG